MAISKIGVQATGFAEANVGLPIPNISLENRAAEAANGTIFFNTSNNAIEVYANGAWSGIGSAAVASPTITSINGDISSGNTGSTLDIVGLNFDTDGILVQGTLRFIYGGTTTDVTVTPTNGTAIDDVIIPAAVLSQAAETTGTIQFIRSDQKGSNIFTKNMTADTFVSVSYVVVAGGGGGGSDRGGGGGAGGHLSGSLGILTSPATYTVTVGSGGGNGTYNVSRGSPGGNSVFASITSIGGGGGGSGGGVPTISSGGFGGSGGGRSNYTDGTTFGSGIPGQGNNGAIGNGSGAGGGGGAGGAGQTGPVAGAGGAGGVGLATPITGASVTRAGGGGGGGGPNPGGAGGTGGGGAGSGGDSSAKATAGTTNTGGGGGGGTGGGSSQNSGANGGSGVVLLRYSGYTLSNPGGGLTYSTGSLGDGSTLATFTAGTGSITFS